MTPKDERYEISRLARRTRGLCRAEKQALAFIAETQTMQNGMCNKALKNGEDFGYSRRALQWGIHGKRRNGKLEFAGLLARGIVSAAGYLKGGRAPGGHGLTAEYTINRDVLLRFIPEVEDYPEPSEKDETKGVHARTSSFSSFPITSTVWESWDGGATLSDPSTPPLSDSTDDVATAAKNQSQAPSYAVLPKPAPAGDHSIQPIGRKEGSLRDFAGEEQHSDDEPEPVSAQDRRRMRQEYAIEKATEFRALPQSIRDKVTRLRQKCRVEWDYWRTHDEDGDFIENESDYRLPVFPSPKAASQLKLAKKCVIYTESQIVGAWKKFVNRPQGFEGLDFPWANFFSEFDDYVEAESEAIAVGGAR